MAHCLAELLEAERRSWIILAQDDYFRLPPKSNHRKRLEGIDWVGPGEVRLDLLDEHAGRLRDGGDERLTKPLVDFDRDAMGSETVSGGPFDVVIAEGTYTGTLANADLRVFIDRDYRQTKKARLARARDPDVAFLDKVLAIEHEIIRQQSVTADIVIEPPPEERDVR